MACRRQYQSGLLRKTDIKYVKSKANVETYQNDGIPEITSID